MDIDGNDFFQDGKFKPKVIVEEPTLLEKVKELYNSGELTDVDFVLRSSETKTVLKSHRFVLSMASDVFRTMFYGTLPEKDLVVHIDDVEPEAFTNILQYIYTGEVSIKSFSVALATAYATKKYMLSQNLMDLCMQSAETYIDLEHVMEAFQVSILFEHNRLRSSVKLFLVTHAGQVLSSESFLGLPTDYMLQLVEDIAEYVNPCKLFVALVAWTKKQDSSECLRTMLMPFFPSIRFLAMSTEEFMRIVGTTCCLSDQEFTSISLHIVRCGVSRQLPRWLNNQRHVSSSGVDYILDLSFRNSKETVAQIVHMVLSFQVLTNGVFLKGVLGSVRTTGNRLPPSATLTYVNHSTKFSTKIICKIESAHKMKAIPGPNDFLCLLPNPRMLEVGDSVTLNLTLTSDENTLTYSKGSIAFREYAIQSGKVTIQLHPIKECGLLAAVILSQEV